MSFLSALFLLALPLIGVPIALHFYKGRQVDVVEWGAMSFLVDAVSDGRRWEKLEELLLMLLRVAAVAALVLAMAQPLVRGSWLGVHERRQVTLVIDDSLSTSLDAGGDTVFEFIQREATDYVNSLNAEDEVQVLAASGVRWVTPDSVAATASGKRRLVEIIKSLKPTEASADLLACVLAAERQAAGEPGDRRAATIFTDGQLLAFGRIEEEDRPLRAWEAWAEASRQGAQPLTVSVVECGPVPQSAGNLAVGGADASGQMIRVGDQVKLTCEVANYGAKRSEETGITWRHGDDLVAKARVPSLAPGELHRVTATAKPPGSGSQLLVCSLDQPDALPLDQTAPLVLEITRRAPLLVVEGGGANDGVEISAGQHLSAALGYVDGQPQSWRSVYEPKLVGANQLSGVDLAEYRAVVVMDPTALSTAEVDRLKGYVAVGGGLWVTLDANAEVDRFNSVWHDDGEGLCPLPIGGLLTDPGADGPIAPVESDGGAATIHPPEGDHPATAQLANTTQLDIDKAAVTDHWRFVEREDIAEAAEVSVLLRSGGGDPLVVERFYGKGRVITQALPLDLAWSNLPLLKAYVVMVHDWLDYIAAPSRDRHNLSVGAPLVAQAPVASGAVTAKVTTPLGEEIPLTPRGDIAERLFRFTQTTLPGVYRVQFQQNGKPVDEAIFQAPRPMEESRLERIDEPMREALNQSAGIVFGSPATAEPASGSVAPPKAPFWWTLLASLAALIIAELLLALRVGSRRMGLPTMAS